ncbi:MAG: alpha/beta hydrolase [Lentilitoribacter sp.]|uniref:alpha/beta hydrolase n=1 Tax=Tateyamaria sp. TaxID=1929288 RepID=UPI00327F9853
MSLRSRILNPYLRLTEKPFLTRASNPAALRRILEIKSRLFFHSPLGVNRAWHDLAGAPALHITPRETNFGRTLFYIHGGAHVFGSPSTHAAMLSSLAKRVGARAVLPRYPLAPEQPFPAAPDHCLAAYRALLATGVNPAELIVGGDSAGGNLAFALLADLCAGGDPLPAGVFALSPLLDLSSSGDSIRANAARDVILPTSRLKKAAQNYLNGHAAEDPRASPLFADFTGAPPVWLTVGDTEILLDDSVRLAERLKAQRVKVDLTVEQDLPHVWPIFHNLIPEANATLDQLAAWITTQTETSAPTR